MVEFNVDLPQINPKTMVLRGSARISTHLRAFARICADVRGFAIDLVGFATDLLDLRLICLVLRLIWLDLRLIRLDLN